MSLLFRFKPATPENDVEDILADRGGGGGHEVFDHRQL
jgi:hypothetical protein